MAEGPTSLPPCDIQYKIVLVGDSGVGKTSLILKFVDDKFSEETTSIGIDYKFKVITVKGKKIAIVIWDTAGQERFRTISGTFYKGADGIIVVYDITDEESFRSVQPWMTEIDRYVESPSVQMLLVGNKTDQSDKRIVSKSQAEDTAEKIPVKYIETSAKSGDNVATMFEDLVKGIFENGGGSQGANGGGANTGDIIRVRATSGQKNGNAKKRKCCSRN